MKISSRYRGTFYLYPRPHTTLRNPTANESNDKLQSLRRNLRMAMRPWNEVVDFPFSPASGIPNAVVIKKVQSDSRIIRSGGTATGGTVYCCETLISAIYTVIRPHVLSHDRLYSIYLPELQIFGAACAL